MTYKSKRNLAQHSDFELLFKAGFQYFPTIVQWFWAFSQRDFPHFPARSTEWISRSQKKVTYKSKRKLLILSSFFKADFQYFPTLVPWFWAFSQRDFPHFPAKGMDFHGLKKKVTYKSKRKLLILSSFLSRISIFSYKKYGFFFMFLNQSFLWIFTLSKKNDL